MESRLSHVLPALTGSSPAGPTEDLLRALTTHTAVGIFLSDAGGSCRYVNARWCELTGLSDEQALGDGWVAALHPDDRERVAAEWERAASAGRDSIIEYRFLRPDGGVRWIEGYAAAFRDERGSLIGWIGSCLDVTAHREAEQRLEQERELFSVAFDGAPTGVAIVGLDGRWLRANRALCEIFGYAEADLLARSVADVTYPDDFGANFEHVLRLVQGAGGAYRTEKRYVRSDGTVIWASISVSLVCDEQGAPLRYIAHIEDVSDRKRAEQELRQLAERDPLTGLPNRRSFQEQLDRRLRRQADTREGFVLLLCDLDGFKEINDTLGHDYGDKFLVQVGQQLSRLLRPDDVLARLGGDEFAIILPTGDAHGEDVAAAAAARIQQALQRPLVVDGVPLRGQASVGIACCPDDARDATLLFQRADIALYHAKRSGQQHSRYDARHDGHDPARLELLAALERAIEADELLLHYQPKLSLRTGEVMRVEALLRWDHPERGLLGPCQFLQAAEQTTLMRPLTLWVVERALTQQALWRQEQLAIDVAVNLSPRNLTDPDLVDRLRETLARHRQFSLLLEITESALTDDPARAREQLQQLRRLGVRLALDDFGRGYTSLAFLSSYPLQQIKVDHSFVTEIHDDPARQAIVRAVVGLAHDLGLEVVAEGVETARAEHLVRQFGCDLAQGYHYTAPLPPDDVRDWIVERRRMRVVA